MIKEFTKIIAILILFSITLSLIIWWPIYKYIDCKKVGHTMLYCVMDIGH